MMKKSLILMSLVCSIAFACTPATTPTPSTSSSPTASSSPSATPSDAPSTTSSSQPSATPASTTPTVSTPVACTAEPSLTVGQEYDSKIFEKLVCNTDVRVGSKWTYSATVMGITTDTSVEILKMENGMVTSRSEVMIQGKKEFKEVTSTSASGYTETDQNALKFVYQGKEDVTVPSGSYPQAYKLKASKTQDGFTMDLTYYVSKKVGAVKVISELKNVPVIGTQKTEVVLKEFKS